MVKPLTLGRMPRVFVHLLALDEGDQWTIRECFAAALDCPDLAPSSAVQMLVRSGDRLVDVLVRILELPREERRRLVGPLNAALDRLVETDFFGTENQLDPRGGGR